MRVHYINENKHNLKRRYLYHGRWFWHFDNANPNAEIYAELVLGGKNFHLATTISKAYVSEHTMSFVFAIPLFALYWGFTCPWLEKKNFWGKLVGEDRNKITKYTGVDGSEVSYHKHAEERDFGISIYDWMIFINLGNDTRGLNNNNSKWKEFSFDIKDFFLGRTKISEKIIEEKDVKIPMPEKEYDANVQIVKVIHKRKFLPIPFSFIRARVEIPGGIPHPGKGTCSWNCGEDRTYSYSLTAYSVTEAVCKVVSDITRIRMTYPL